MVDQPMVKKLWGYV